MNYNACIFMDDDPVGMIRDKYNYYRVKKGLIYGTKVDDFVRFCRTLSDEEINTILNKDSRITDDSKKAVFDDVFAERFLDES